MSVEASTLRDHPDDRFIQELRQAYPVEKEIDRVLTKKMRKRAYQQYIPISLDQVIKATSALIKNRTNCQFEITDAKWLGGGASKIQLFLEVLFQENHDKFVKGKSYPLVLRMEPPESVVETSRRREFEVLQLVKDRIPVPDVYWIDDEPEFLPYPGLVYQFVSGVTKVPGQHSKQVSGIGTNFASDIRGKISDQFVRHLAELHTLPQELFSTLRFFDIPTIGTVEASIKQANWWRRVWEEDRGENTPLVEVAYKWLVENAPVTNRYCLVHGDFRNGNFLFDPSSFQINAWLDWELCLIGDYHQDLAWVAFDIFSTRDEGKELLCGLIEREEFFDKYRSVSGLTVDNKKLEYYSVFCNYMAVIHMLGTAYRVAKGSKSHQDIIVSSFSKMGFAMLDRLRCNLQEVM